MSKSICKLCEEPFRTKIELKGHVIYEHVMDARDELGEAEEYLESLSPFTHKVLDDGTIELTPKKTN